MSGKEYPRIPEPDYRKLVFQLRGQYVGILNVRRAIEAGDRLLEMGHIPFIFWHFVSPKPCETWLEIDRRWIDCCDAVLRLQGESTGADSEVAYALTLGKEVFYSLEAIK